MLMIEDIIVRSNVILIMHYEYTVNGEAKKKKNSSSTKTTEWIVNRQKRNIYIYIELYGLRKCSPRSEIKNK